MADLIDSLIADANNVDFFQAVSLIEDLLSSDYTFNPKENKIQFIPDNSISFPPNDISAIIKNNQGVAFLLSFMGLVGVTSPLPSYFSEYLSDSREKPDGFHDLLTIFNQRIYSLFYQAWKKYCFIKNVTGSKTGNLIGKIASLSGIIQKFPDLLIYSRYFNCGRSASGLESILFQFFGGIPIHIEEFVPRKVVISNIMSLGNGYALGKTSVLGTTMIDYAGKFQIIVGPVLYDLYLKILSDEIDFRFLINLIDSFLAEPLEYDIVILMKQKNLVKVNLGAANVGLGKASCLGSSTELSESVVSVLNIANNRYSQL